MQTFLTVAGILLLAGVATFITLVAWLRTMGLKGAIFVLREGAALLVGKAQAAHVPEELRQRCVALSQRVNGLPTPSVWNARRVLASLKPLAQEMGELGRQIEQLEADMDDARTDAITVDATDAAAGEQQPQQPLMLTAPRPAGKSNEEILADFRKEWVEPGNRGVKDAWLIGSGEDLFIQYQLSLDVADTGQMPDVPVLYQGVSTIITWFPRK